MSSVLTAPVAVAQDSDPEVLVTKLDSNTFNSAIAATGKLAVVKFFAPWCRACKAIELEYKKTAKSYKGGADSSSADFYEVDISKDKELCKRQQVMAFPSIQFYVPGIGCVERFTITPRKRGELRQRLDALLGSASIDELRAVDPDLLKPLVRFKELMGAMEVIQNAPKYLTQKNMANFLSEEQKEEIKGLFKWLDHNRDGVIDAEDIETARTMLMSTGCKWDAACFPVDELLSTVLAANDNSMIDENAFLRMMSKRATEEITDAETLHGTFNSIDKDGDGALDVSELFECVTKMNNALCQDDDMPVGPMNREQVEQLFRAFDFDESGLIHYEEFVNMLVGRW
jgi:Ca2+-binding EF-hand superfamily protein